MKMRSNIIYLLVVLFFGTTINSEAELYESDGSGSEATPTAWSDCWVGGGTPTLDGTDDAQINAGGVQQSGSDLLVAGGSSLVLTNDAYLGVDNDAKLDLNGGNLTINNGKIETDRITVLNSSVSISGDSVLDHYGDWNFGLSGGDSGTSISVYADSIIQTVHAYDFNNNAGPGAGEIHLHGGTMLAYGEESNPLRATNGIGDGGLNFVDLGSRLQIDQYTGSTALTAYMENRLTLSGNSMFWIDGQDAAGFGDSYKVNDKWLDLTVNDHGTYESGTLTLVPEPSTFVLASMMGIIVMIRRWLHWRRC